LDYAHQKGVIHRDVKPSSLLLSEEGRVVLGDFGIAMDVAQKTLGKVFGSPRYIAPEQARNSADAVSQSDLYSLGVILYEMLTGRPPFEDPSPTSLALQHLTQEPPAPRSINPALSQAVEDVLLKALRKQPEERYQSGSQLMTALEQALNQLETKPSITGEDSPPVYHKAISHISLTERVADHMRSQPAFPESVSQVEGLVKPTSAPKITPLMWWGAGCATLLVLVVLLAILGSTFISNNNLPDQAAILRVSSTQRITATASQPPTALTTQNVPASSGITPIVLPTNSPTMEFTASASPTAAATNTPQPSETSQPELTETSAPAQPTRAGDNLFAMYYDDRSFYIKNLSGSDRSIFPFAFEKVDDAGNFINRFEGWRWGNIYSRFR
ncbi:MAG: serine/threonine protein kinase, partial [Anaerolineales bacterium]